MFESCRDLLSKKLSIRKKNECSTFLKVNLISSITLGLIG